MDMNELLEPFERMLEGVCAPAAVRAVEKGGSADAIRRELVDSGFLDALVAEEAGGAGLSLADVAPLLMALGKHAVPLPVAETMVARALLAADGKDAPGDMIALATVLAGRDVVVPFGLVADHVLLDTGDQLVLVDAASGDPAKTGVEFSLSARMRWDAPTGIALARPDGGLRPIAAVLRAAAIAGAADRLLEMTAAYANERVQFGKPIGRLQVLQQYMAVMAEDTVASRIAAQLACASGMPPSLEAAATAKSVASAAAPRIAATAHAVHGAIGISEELDVQLFTRRLHEWRLADGSESYWNRQLGKARLAGGPDLSVDWIRDRIFA